MTISVNNLVCIGKLTVYAAHFIYLVITDRICKRLQ